MKSFHSLKNRLRCLLLVTGVLFSYAPSFAGSARHVLIINSYHKGYPFSDNELRGIEDIFKLRAKDVEISIEFMDAKRIHDAQHQQNLYQLFKHKYHPSDFDLIITSDNDALEFLIKYRADLFPDVPVVFCGINDFNAAMLKGNKNITGVIEAIDYKETINLSFKLQPKVRRIVVVSDETVTGKAHVNAVRSIIPDIAHSGQFTFLSLGDMSMDELLEKLQSLTSDSAVLLLSHFIDKTGMMFSQNESMLLITQACPVPIYTVTDSRVGYGTLGGMVVNGFYQGKTAAELALRILGGENINAIPVSMKGPNTYMFDYAQLLRRGIRESVLPEGSIIINKPATFYSQYTGRIWFAVTIFGALVFIITMLIVNITRRRQAEEILRKSEQRFRSIIENSLDGIYLFDDRGLIVEWNPGAEKITMLTKKQVMGKFIWDIYYDFMPDKVKAPDIREQFKAYLLELPKRELSPPALHEILIYLPDGTRKFIQNSTFLMTLHDRVTCGVIARDITERKQTEEALRQYYQQLMTIMDSLDSFMYIADMKTYEVLFVNEYGRKIWGDITGKKCWQSIQKGQDGPCPFCTNDKLLTAAGTPAGLYSWEFQNTANGKWYDCRDKAIQWHDGRIVRMEIATDITGRKCLEEDLVQAKKFETMSSFSAGIAHDFNNLLSGVLGYITLSMDDIKKPENALKYLGEAEKIIFKAKDITGEFLTLAGAGIEYKNTAGAGRLIKEAALHSLHGSNIQFEFVLPEDDREVHIAPSLLSRIISNAVDNSRTAMPDEGIVKIQAEYIIYKEEEEEEEEEDRLPLKGGMYFFICISDTGCGISKENLPRIFDPYYSTKQRGVQKGMGLGLAVVYSIVTRLNGYIRVKSQEGAGTQVFIYLPAPGEPAAGDEKKQEAKAPERKAEAAAGTKRILFMDDEEALRTTFKIMLGKAGYKVDAAGSGEEAIKIYAQAMGSGSPFDAVILDLSIVGGMGGEETIQKLLELDPQVKAIVSSGYSTDPIIVNYGDYGFKGSVTKPATRAQILEELQKLW